MMSSHPAAFERYQAGGVIPPAPDDPVIYTETLKPVQALTIQDHARQLVYEYVTSKLDQHQTEMRFEPEDVYLVWFNYIGESWKAMVSTTLPDGMYYEVTHVKETRETYLDVYKRWDKVTYPAPTPVIP